MASRDRQVNIFTWRVSNISILKGRRLSSNYFVAWGLRWRVVSHPTECYMFAYLEVAANETMPNGWSVQSHVSLSLDSLRTLDSTKELCCTLSMNSGDLRCGYAYPCWPIDYDVIDTVVFNIEFSTRATTWIRTATTNEPKVIESDDQLIPKAAASSRNYLIDEISSVTSGLKSTTSGSLQLQDRANLVDFLAKSVETISEANAFDDVEGIVLKIDEHETNPVKKVALRNLLSRVAEFKQTIPGSITIIQTSSDVETSRAVSVKEMEGRLIKKQNQIRILESNITRLGVEEANLELEMQILIARKEKLACEKKLNADELEETNQEAFMELKEFKKHVEERDRAFEEKMRAEERLAHFNASWKLFMDYLGL